MMGQQAAAQNELFYEFNLEQHIPTNHLLRQIDIFLDFDQIRQHLITQPFQKIGIVVIARAIYFGLYLMRLFNGVWTRI